MEPIAILGGTFDPVHYGHLRLAAEVRVALALPEVRLLPSRDPPHRTGPGASPAQRLDMLELAVKEFPGLVVDDRELRREGKSYTVTTLEALREHEPTRPLLLLLGADAFAGLPAWHRWEEIPRLAHLVVVPRPGVNSTAAPDAWLSPPLATHWRERVTLDPARLRDSPAGAIFMQPVTAQPISASAIRTALAATGDAWTSLPGLLPPAVLAYIDRNQLYRSRPDAP